MKYTRDAIIAMQFILLIGLGALHFDLSREVNSLKYSKASSKTVDKRLDAVAEFDEKVLQILGTQTEILRTIKDTQ